MKSWLQRIRGALGLGLTWATGWAPIGAAVGALLHMLLPGSPMGLGSVIALNAGMFAVLGFIGGTVFAGVLRLTEGRNSFDKLSLPRFAAWGAIGGALLGSLAVWVGLWGGGVGLLGAGMVGAASVLGGLSAAGSLAIARRAGDRGLLEGDAGVEDVGLTEAERLQLLGGGS